MTTTAREIQIQQGKRLEYFTIGWNSLEGLISVGAGVMAGSIALVGFGIDSVIEVTSGVALLWRLSLDAHAQRREHLERASLKVVGLSFLGLAAYVAIEAIITLVRHEPPHASYTGIVLSILSLAIMPLLARAKRRLASAIGSRALHADSRQTDICFYLSVILLAGLALNAGFGWWWADPIAGLAMIPIIVKEGAVALRGDSCCD
jgi:divalent metal cation (Fe/Co/Zn/Cd) transporter